MKQDNDKAHEKWLKKYSKTKQGKLFELLHDIRECRSNLKSYNKITHLAYALSLVTEGTKLEEDAKSIIELVCPEYYK